MNTLRLVSHIYYSSSSGIFFRFRTLIYNYITMCSSVGKGATTATRAAGEREGDMIKLSGLVTCLLHSAFYFNSVVCRLLSVSH